MADARKPDRRRVLASGGTLLASIINSGGRLGT